MFGLGGSETNIKAVITAEDKASSVLKGFGDHVGNLGGVVEKGLKTAAIGLATAGAAATAFGVLSVKAFTESEDLIAQTNAVLKSTGRVAGVTANEVTKLATALEKQTKFSDEDVRSVENLLLTFTSIGKDIFPQATSTVLDMAQALGEDTKSASIQLGKALQDPVLGVTALRRVGVNFNSSQQEVIKNLVETGHSAKAQHLILAELTKEFGGSAKAAGETFSGSLARLKNQLNNVQESIGKVIVQGITPFVTKAAEFVAAIDWDKVIKRTTDVLRDFGQKIEDVGNKVYAIYKQVSDFLAPSLNALWKTISDNLIPVLVKFWKNVIEPLLPVIGITLVGAIWLAINAFNVLLKVVTPVLNFLADHTWIIYGLATAFGILKAAMLLDKTFLALQAGFAVITNSVIPSATAKIVAFRALTMSGMVMGGIAIAGALADIALVMKAVQAVRGAIDAMNAAARSAQSARDAKASTHATLLQLERTGTPAQKARAQYLIMQGYASGTNFAPGGRAIVGEEGAEIVDLPRGSRVTPAPKTKQILSASNPTTSQVTIALNVGLYAGSELEKRKVAMEIFKSLQDLARAKSTTVSQMLGS